jgi:hypothetical protein
VAERLGYRKLHSSLLHGGVTGDSCNEQWENNDMDTDDGWPKVWAEMSDEELRDRLRHYLFLAANSPLKHAKRIAQLVAEADKRGKAEMVDEAREWVKSHGPSKQEDAERD